MFFCTLKRKERKKYKHVFRNSLRILFTVISQVVNDALYSILYQGFIKIN
jgi:hypothetical protein